MRDAFLRHIAPTQKKDWVVYAKQPFAGPEEVLKYVARYTHRVAISNNRLLNIDDRKVQFRWKDYRDGNRQKTMTLDADEFIRRFLLYVLPMGSSVFAITASSPIAIRQRNSLCADSSCRCRRPHPTAKTTRTTEIDMRHSRVSP